ncbi:helix-turn-helix transcriptional regulator [Asticcacaulis endophyticus]|uniref:HTH cro/C1-type domain-containing protein n=1 Tax=Asticcacaulis endophyticus TaxID=1395890 RepID=A0A918UTE4_9CAUL|nr:helix-turn-helix domain-containing protein [Asticcacaulis endophyticus]GGZ31944.1 hypothetical protein GCM10011273_17450 [Asticcacaulis endophyticus]
MSLNFTNPPPLDLHEVKAFRKYMGWTQADLAKATGLSRQGIEKWEQPGTTVPGHWRYVFQALRIGLHPWTFERLKKLDMIRRGVKGEYAFCRGEEVVPDEDFDEIVAELESINPPHLSKGFTSNICTDITVRI